MTTVTPETVRDNTPEILAAEPTAKQLEARARIYAMPLEKIDPAAIESFPNEEMFWKFERLRAEDPVHFTSTEDSAYGDYWSVTKWDDIIKIDTDSVTFSNEAGITIGANRPDGELIGYAPENDTRTPEQIQADNEGGIKTLLSMDPPEHGLHRGAVSESVGPANLADLEPLIRERIAGILDALPIGEEFDWVDKVSIELTAMTLATLFDYPQEKRRQLTWWSDVVTMIPGPDQPVKSFEEKDEIMAEFRDTLVSLFQDRVSKEPKGDFISLLAHSPHAGEFTLGELIGDGIVLLVGGNDTTRNTITGSVYALNKWPEQFDKLRENPALIPSMVSETVRWQTPLTHMMRVATKDVELGGKTIHEGDRVVLWFVSGNRDDAKVENPNEYIIDRRNPRQHLSFGFGIHRCLGNRLAELQLRIIWEEMLKRFPEITVVGEPVFSYSNFVKGYESMQVIIPRRN